MHTNDEHLVYTLESSDQRKLILKRGAIPKLAIQDIRTEGKEDQRSQLLHEDQRVQTEATAASGLSNESQVETSGNHDILVEPVRVEKQDASIQVDTIEMDKLFLKKVRNVIEIQSEEQLTAWTGISNFKMIDVITEALQMVPESSILSKYVISLKNVVMLVFIKLKTNLSFRCISSMFDLSPRTASRYFITAVPILADVMRIAVP